MWSHRKHVLLSSGYEIHDIVFSFWSSCIFTREKSRHFSLYDDRRVEILVTLHYRPPTHRRNCPLGTAGAFSRSGVHSADYNTLNTAAINCLYSFFVHLKLALLMQFPALNDEKYYYSGKINSLKFIKINNRTSHTIYVINDRPLTRAGEIPLLSIRIINFSCILFTLKLAWNSKYGPSSIKVIPWYAEIL